MQLRQYPYQTLYPHQTLDLLGGELAQAGRWGRQDLIGLVGQSRTLGRRYHELHPTVGGVSRAFDQSRTFQVVHHGSEVAWIPGRPGPRRQYKVSLT